MLRDILFNDGIFIRLKKRIFFYFNFDYFLKCEKYPNNNSYSFLLPKTYDDDEDLTVTNWEAFLESRPFKVDAQVSYFSSIFFRKCFLLFFFCSVFVQLDHGQQELKLSNHLFKMLI